MRLTALVDARFDAEPAAQVAMVLGSYAEDLKVTGTFSLGFGTATPVSGVTAATLQSALNTLLGAGNAQAVDLGGGNYRIELLGTLYLTNAVQFSATGSATISIDQNTIKLASPWAAEPQHGAGFEVQNYSAVKLPSIKVTVYSQATPTIVVFEPAGGTAVTQGGSSAPVQVRLSSKPLPALLDGLGNYTVTISDNGSGLLSLNGVRDTKTLTFTASNWDHFQPLNIAGYDDGVVRGFHPSDLLATGLGYYSYLSTVTIGDNNYPGVTVTESGGSTNVVEYQNPAIDSVAFPSNFPSQDSYTLALTKEGVYVVTADEETLIPR